MTAHHDLKHIIRERQQKTGESYSTARSHVMRARAELLGLGGESAPSLPTVVEAAVLKVNRNSARIRVLGNDTSGSITFRSADVWKLVPGFIAKLHIEKRWTYSGDEYASGRVEETYLDVTRLGLEPLTLEDQGLYDVAEVHGSPEDSDPYALIWQRLTEQPRPSFEMHEIAWGAQAPGSDEDNNVISDAAELAQVGKVAEARDMLMEVLCDDLRCIDAHAHLGNQAFVRSPETALLHYEVGLRIGELSLPPGFDGLLLWGMIYNRPFLRCLHGYGLCLWRLGRFPEAQQVFERLLSLNPPDNQGARECLFAVQRGEVWEDFAEPEDDPRPPRKRPRRHGSRSESHQPRP